MKENQNNINPMANAIGLINQISKNSIAEMSNQLIDMVESGEMNPLLLKVKLKAIKEIIEKVEGRILEHSISEAIKYKGQDFENCKIEIRNSGDRLQYDEDSTYSEIKLKLKQSVAEKTEANEMESELEVIMFGKITCPKCEHNFIIGGEHNISDVEENLKQIKKLSKDIANSIIEIESKIREKRDKLSKIVTKMELSNDLKDGIDNINRAIAKIEIDNKNYTASVEKCDLKIAEEEAKTMNNEIQVIADKIEHLRGDNYNNKLKEIEAIKLSLEDNKFYQLHFSNKGFKSYLARKSIKNIQDICNWYLIKFNINLQVSISGYTTLKSGEVRDKIEVTIIRNGYERGAFKKHSGGEKNRVDLCGLLTLNKLVNNSVEYGRGLNLLIVDEYVGYLDAEGKHEIIDILSNSGITSILVMHEVGKIQYENKLYFNKINGETKISKNEK